MKKKIYFNFIFNTNKKEKVELFIDKEIRPYIEVSEIISFNQYWKDEAMYTFEFNSIINSNGKEIIFDVLKKVSLFSNHWQVSYNLESDECFDFSGVCSNDIKYSIIHFISYSLEEEA